MNTQHWYLIAVVLLSLSLLATRCKSDNVTYSIASTIITNKVADGTYNRQTNGFTSVKEHFYVYWVGGNTGFSSTTNYGYEVQNSFEEKVTTSYYQRVKRDVYRIHVGDLTHKYATRSTVLSRWKIVHRQKINMQESTEIIKENQ